MSTVPVDTNSAEDYRNLNCESKPTEEERAQCYQPKIIELTNYQEEKHRVRVAIGVSVTILVVVPLLVGLYFGMKKFRAKYDAKKLAAEAATS